jgi:hypothetical protein
VDPGVGFEEAAPGDDQLGVGRDRRRAHGPAI